jgi:thiamine-phosphate diphosphorylase
MVLPRLYAILDPAYFSNLGGLISAAQEFASAGVQLIQYRNKSGNARVMLEQARELRSALGSHPSKSALRLRSGQAAGGAASQLNDVSHPFANDAKEWGTRVLESPSKNQNSHVSQNRRDVGHPTNPVRPKLVQLIMNDRADLCLAADFDGVHVGQDDLSPESVRRIIGPDRWLGVSTHNPGQLREADLTSADYLAIGPVFATSSKEKPDPVVGLDGVRRARALTRKPLVAIGGITRANAASVIEAGADSVAVISDLIREPGKSAEEFLRILR